LRSIISRNAVSEKLSKCAALAQARFENGWIGFLDEHHQRAKCVAVDMLPLSQEPGKEGSSAAADGTDAIDVRAGFLV
jgi:hypothetical protein